MAGGKSFEIGNQFWKLRTKHGRDKLFESADLLWAEAMVYFAWCDANPLYKVEALKKPEVDIDLITGQVVKNYLVTIPIKRPYTQEGLCNYLNVDESYFRVMECTYDEDLDADFLTVLRAIRRVIRQQQIEGGLAGTLNANLVARLNGIAEKKELEASLKAESDIDYDQLDDETLEKIAKAKRK